MCSTDYESVALVKPEVFVYRIPPLSTNRGHKAADWKLDAPDWTGRMRLVALGAKLELRLEDKNSGTLFAKCPIDEYPGLAIESVTDSSRYFVIRLQDDSGRTAFIGLGFSDRGDSFDFNVCLQDHFKYLEKSAALDAEPQDAPKRDLGFKQGETITINIGKKTGGTSRPRPATTSGGDGPVPFLPPPPSSSSTVQRMRSPVVAVDSVTPSVPPSSSLLCVHLSVPGFAGISNRPRRERAGKLYAAVIITVSRDINLFVHRPLSSHKPIIVVLACLSC